MLCLLEHLRQWSLYRPELNDVDCLLTLCRIQRVTIVGTTGIGMDRKRMSRNKILRTMRNDGFLWKLIKNRFFCNSLQTNERRGMKRKTYSSWMVNFLRNTVFLFVLLVTIQSLIFVFVCIIKRETRPETSLYW